MSNTHKPRRAPRGRLAPEAYINGILAGDRLLLSRAITLVESRLPSDQALAEAVLQGVLPHTGKSLRLGITGVPGVGKSTFIEALGTHLTSLGLKVAVLAVDPTSQRSKGSIMGDKTRMEQLAHDPMAYVRPSAAGSTLGGVASKTREAMLLCEAAGFQVVIIETVGVGQSETAVRNMVDFFLLLMLAGAGDELQGIKKGIMEMADALVITKADGGNEKAAKRARAEYRNALHLFRPPASGWLPQVGLCSALQGNGIAEVWGIVQAFEQKLKGNGHWEQHRRSQRIQWLHETLGWLWEQRFYSAEAVQQQLPQLEEAVAANTLAPTTAARRLFSTFMGQ